MIKLQQQKPTTMKKIFVLPVLGLLLITACNTKENAALRKENEQLRKELDELREQALNEKGKPNRLEPLDIGDFKLFIKNLQTAQSVKIPVSLEFEEDNLKYMLDGVDSQGHDAEGVLAYPILENGYLKLALVPYYNEGGVMKHFGANELGAYNYSHMCPPAASGAVNAALLFGAGTKTYDFRK
jgi:hypothetical protein